MYAKIDKYWDELIEVTKQESAEVDFNDLAQTVKLVGIFFLLADYNKYALGFFQLASMVELTIVIRETINQIKKV